MNLSLLELSFQQEMHILCLFYIQKILDYIAAYKYTMPDLISRFDYIYLDYCISNGKAKKITDSQLPLSCFGNKKESNSFKIERVNEGES